MVALESLRKMLGRRLLRWADALLQAGGGAPASEEAAQQPAVQQDEPVAAPSARELWEARVAAWAVQPGHGEPVEMADAPAADAPAADVALADVPRTDAPMAHAGEEARVAAVRRAVAPAVTPPPRYPHPAGPVPAPPHDGPPQAPPLRPSAATASTAWHRPAAPRAPAASSSLHARADEAAHRDIPEPTRSRVPATQVRPATPFGRAVTRPAAVQTAPRAADGRALPQPASVPRSGEAGWHMSGGGALLRRADYHFAEPALRVGDPPARRAVRTGTDTDGVPAVRGARVLHMPDTAPSAPPRRMRQPAATPQAGFERPARPASAPATTVVLPAGSQGGTTTAWPELPAWPPAADTDQPASASGAVQRLQRLEREHGG